MVLRAAAAAKNSKVDIGQGYIYVGLGRLPVPLFSSTMNVRMPLSIVEGIPGQKEAMLQTDTSFFPLAICLTADRRPSRERPLKEVLLCGTS